VDFLKRIRIENFQCHEALDIQFDSKITTICGPSDTGKSAILRAIRWVAFNRPRGEGFRRHGSDKTSISILFSNGWRVRRLRGKENCYQTKSPGEDSVSHKYKAMGTDVPEGVSQILNLGPENFQSQHDPLFWFSLTAGEVAKEINSIVDLTVIDDAMAHVARLVRKTKSEIDVVQDRLGEAEADAKETEHAVELHADFIRLKESQERLEGLTDARNGLSLLLEQMDDALVDCMGFSEAADEGARALAQVVRFANELTQLDTLASILQKIGIVQEEVARELPNMDSMTEMLDHTRSVSRRHEELDTDVAELRKAVKIAYRAKKSLEMAEGDLAAELGGQCPLCGGEMDV